MNLEKKLLDEMIKIINCIKENQYDTLEKDGYLMHLSKEEIAEELRVYGGEISATDYNDYEKSFQYMNIKDTNIYKAYLEFWIDNVQSDLTLICDIFVDQDMSIIKSTIEDVHVL